VAKVIAVEGDVELTILEVFTSLDPLKLVAKASGQQDPTRLHADEGQTCQLTMVFDELVAKTLNGKSERLAAE